MKCTLFKRYNIYLYETIQLKSIKCSNRPLFGFSLSFKFLSCLEGEIGCTVV